MAKKLSSRHGATAHSASGPGAAAEQRGTRDFHHGVFERLRVKPGAKVDLSKYDPADKLGFEKSDGEAFVLANREKMSELHELLWADNSKALLVVLQGMDTSGKDGVIRHCLTGLNPQGCKVVSFKVPSEEEADHDFLWRVHMRVPGKGEIGIFNRSHYEAVLVERVMELTPKSVWSHRYEQINEFEELLSRSGTRVVKLFLHISKEEQKARLEARLKDPAKNWKFSMSDLEHRQRWDDYMRAFEDVLERCSTAHAPWYVIPSDRKWVRNICASSILLRELEAMDLKWPRTKLDVTKIRVV